MKKRGMWAIVVASVLLVSVLLINYPVTACFGQTTSCEGESVYQGDGGATDYWYADLYPPTHEMDKGEGTEWIINVKGGGGCSGYEHCTVTDNTAPTGWTTTIKMGTIYTGSFHYIESGNPAVNTGDDIEDREFYIGSNWNFDIIYNITSPIGAAGGEYADMICTVYVVGYSPENQHDYVYLHLRGKIFSAKPPAVMVTFPGMGDVLSGTELITWDAITPEPSPAWSFDIFLSADLGQTYPYTLVTGVTGPGPSFSWSWDTTTYPDNDQYLLKVRGFDGAELGEGFSSGNFTIENNAPAPPTNLIISFGLITAGEPTAKGAADNTGSDIERLEEDDGRGYAVIKGKTLEMDTFDTQIQIDPVESAMLHVKYLVNDTGYTGFNSVMWKLESEVTWHSTGITPMNGDMSYIVQSFDLFANGVDTIDEILNLDIMFWNNDGGASQAVVFDYIWVEMKASTNDLGLQWQISSAFDVDHYNIYRSSDGSIYTLEDVTPDLCWRDPGTLLDLNNYYYHVKSVDTRANEGLPTYNVGKYVSSVVSGWNLPSSPLEPLGDTSLTNVLTTIDGNYRSVQSYNVGDSKPWHHWHTTKPAYMNNIAGMDHTHGYYLDVGTSDDLIFLGRLHSPSTTTIPLKEGWNLVGYPRITTEQWDSALISILPNCDIVFRYDTGTGREVEVSGSDNLEPGTGYWIHVSSDCSLIL